VATGVAKAASSSSQSAPTAARTSDGSGGSGSGSAAGATFGLTLMTALSPFWIPHAALGDEFGEIGHFPRFPYDRVPGYMMIGDHPRDMDDAGAVAMIERVYTDPEDRPPDAITLKPWVPEPRRCSGRWDLEYGERFDGLNRIGTHLLLDNASRLGYDAQWDYLHERRSGGRDDHLQLGDFNVVFRFAQSARALFRTGIGVNWIGDGAGTSFGFNFTYGADFFPAQPWIVSSTIDWGCLGRTDLFRGRVTLGANLGRYEVYTGYEYLDIGRTAMNNLVGGVRLWF
jgi:hypothetical protein